MDSIGHRIRIARDARSLTQDALARLCGLTSISVYRYEKGRATPSRQALEHLGAALDVSPSWLFTGEGRGPVDGQPTAGAA